MAGEHFEQVTRWLKSKFPEHPHLKCPLCGHSEWTITQVIAAPTLQNGVVQFAPVIPIVPIICMHCANIVMLGAVQMGLTTLEQKAPPDAEPASQNT